MRYKAGLEANSPTPPQREMRLKKIISNLPSYFLYMILAIGSSINGWMIGTFIANGLSFR